MTTDQAKQVSKFLHTISDFERLGDHAVNISRVAQELHEKSRAFSDAAQYELNVVEDALKEIVRADCQFFRRRRSEDGSKSRASSESWLVFYVMIWNFATSPDLEMGSAIWEQVLHLMIFWRTTNVFQLTAQILQ